MAQSRHYPACQPARRLLPGGSDALDQRGEHKFLPLPWLEIEEEILIQLPLVRERSHALDGLQARLAAKVALHSFSSAA